MIVKFIGRKVKKGLLSLGLDLIFFSSLIVLAWFAWKAILFMLSLAVSFVIFVACSGILVGSIIVLIYYFFQFALPKGD